MLKIKSILSLAAAAILPLASSYAGNYQAATKHLDTDGSLIGYIDFEGDGQQIGTKLNAIYQDLVAQQFIPMPIPIDFTQVFEHLGFGSVKGYGISSKEVSTGLNLNKSLILMHESGPAGLLKMYGQSEDNYLTFDAAKLAPADATAAISGNLDLLPLQESIIAIATDLMGPKGANIITMQLEQPIPTTTITFQQLIQNLSGRIDTFWKQEISLEQTGTFDIWLKFAKAGPLLAELRPLLEESMGAQVIETKNGLKVDLSILAADSGLSGIYLESNTIDGSLTFYSNKDWNAQSEGPRLNTSEAFTKVASKLPKSALFHSYSSGYDLNALLATLAEIPQAAMYLAIGEKVIDLFIGDFLEPNATAMTIVDGSLFCQQYSSYSYKQVAMTVPATFVGLFSAMAIPAFEKVRATSKEKAVTNNLRIIASGGMQYILETGEKSVTYTKLANLPEPYFQPITPVAGESYEDIVISVETEQISVTLEDGQIIAIDL